MIEVRGLAPDGIEVSGDIEDDFFTEKPATALMLTDEDGQVTVVRAVHDGAGPFDGWHFTASDLEGAAKDLAWGGYGDDTYLEIPGTFVRAEAWTWPGPPGQIPPSELPTKSDLIRAIENSVRSGISHITRAGLHKVWRALRDAQEETE